MKYVLVFCLALAPCAVASACGMIDPARLTGSVVVLLSTLILEALIATGCLLFCGFALGPTFIVLVATNCGGYFGLGAILAMANWDWHLFLALALLAIPEALVIKGLGWIPIFTRDDFNWIGWGVSLFAAAAGKLCAYYVFDLGGRC